MKARDVQSEEEERFDTCCVKINVTRSMFFILCRYYQFADPSGRAFSGMVLRPLACKDCGFESHWGRGYVFL